MALMVLVNVGIGEAVQLLGYLILTSCCMLANPHGINHLFIANPHASLANPHRKTQVGG